jgi:hypothetical protein
MQLPSIDRNPNLRPASVDSVSAGANRVIPVAPVNPAVNTGSAPETSPGVVNLVNSDPKPKTADLLYSNLNDAVKRQPEEATAPKDWTIKRPEKEKVEDPPPTPVYQLLMDHLKQMWTAGASAVQIEQVQNQLKPNNILNPAQNPGDINKLEVTYKPTKVNKNENI